MEEVVKLLDDYKRLVSELCMLARPMAIGNPVNAYTLANIKKQAAILDDKYKLLINKPSG
uniref:Uncharacterized protein n=1 Tax=viral metagenome TaxID=1070528 RepID=A0A6C0JSR2_9ZZZZ